MKRVGKNSIALGLVMALITLALSFSANGASKIVAQSESSAITATGLTGIIDSKKCSAVSTGPATNGSGTCGTGLGLSKPAISSFDQTASTGLDGKKGTSTATAQVAGTGINALTTINLSHIGSELGAINTGTILDGIVKGLDPVTKPLFQALLTPLLTQIQTAALTPILAAVQKSLPVSVLIGAVSSKCTLTAGGNPTLESKVAGINILVQLAPGNVITIPVTLKTDPNSALVGAVAPKQIVDGLLAGVETSLNDSLKAALAPLAGLVTTIQKMVVDAVLAQLGPALLAPVGKAIGPILDGTVNKQVKHADGSAEVTALSLNLLGKAATLDLARSKCGPNSTLTPNTNANANANANVNANAIADANANANADAIANANANANADADVTSTLPSTGAPNILPLLFLALGLIAFGTAVLANEKRRLSQL